MSANDIIDGQGKRNDLEELRGMVEQGMTLDEILLADTDNHASRCVGWLSRLIEARDRSIYNSSSSRDIEVYYLYGQTGVGKTSYVMNRYAPEDVYRVSDYLHPFDGYGNQKVLLMDEFSGALPFDQLLNVTDRWRTTLAARYHNRIAMYDTVWIVSNLPLNELYSEIERPRRKAMFRRFRQVIYMTRQGGMHRYDPDEISDYLGDPEHAPAGRFHLLGLDDSLRAEDII